MEFIVEGHHVAAGIWRRCSLDRFLAFRDRRLDHLAAEDVLRLASLILVCVWAELDHGAEPVISPFRSDFASDGCDMAVEGKEIVVDLFEQNDGALAEWEESLLDR